jgi:hypothetical protein
MRLGFWRKCRVCFRWLRISALLLVLASCCAVVWFNRVGLPDFLKSRLVARLHEHGVKLEFTRVRLRFERGIVAENVRIGGAEAGGGPALSLAEVQLQLDFHALLHRRLQVDGLVLRQGKVLWPVPPTNSLKLDNIQAAVRFQTNDTWSLDNFQADFAGAKFTLSGDIKHAPEMRGWEMFRGQKSTNQLDLREQLRKFSDTLREIHFDGTPQLSLSVDGDARDIHSFDIRLKASAPAAQTPWFNARDIQLAVNLTAPAGAPVDFAPAWGFWTNIQPYKLEWSARLAQLKSEKLNADSVECGGFWSAPELVVTNLSARLPGGTFAAAAQLNIATRGLDFTASSSFDLHAITALLPEKARAWIVEISWKQPPSLQADGSLTLPAWTNAQPDWRGEVQPTIRLNGEATLANVTFRSSTVDSAHTHFSYSNLVWRLPDLALAQAKTQLELSGSEDDATKNYRLHVSGAFDPETIRPFFTASNAQRGFEVVKLAGPLALDMDVGGRLDDLKSTGVRGRVALTNISIRAESFGDFESELDYTNGVLIFLNPLSHTGDQMLTGDSLTLDFNRRLILFTNGFSTADPYPITRAIGPKTAQAVEAYHFLSPPTARVNGQILLGGMNGGPETTNVAMRFDIIKGAPFEWMKFRTTNIMGTIFWEGQTLTLSNVTAAVYGGEGNGSAYFDFRPAHEGADYRFMMDVTNVNLHALALDLISPMNHYEGALAGKITVTHADSRDWRKWDGFGHARLRDGLIWDAPVFGVLSPVLNAVTPGLGSSRATDAGASFTITNGVIYTDSLKIRATLAQLEYTGTMDLSGNVKALVTAKLLNNTPVFGSVFSFFLWPVSKVFEYQITGTLKDPKREPAYFGTRVLLMPLNPIRSMEEMFPGGTVTNGPPQK